MIPPALLFVLVPVLAALFALTVVVIIAERLRHEWRSRRTDQLRQVLAAESEPGAYPWIRSRVARLTTTQLQQFEIAGMPEEAQAIFGNELRARHGEEHLRRCAEGEEKCSVWQRVAALYVLVAGAGRDDSVYRALDIGLRSGEAHVEAAAIRMLMRLDDRRAAQLLVSALLDVPQPRTRVAAALDRMSVPRSDLLAPMLRHPEAPVRAWGARLAGRLAATEWAVEIRELTGDPSAVVRRTAVEALGRIGSPADGDLLLARFSDRSAIVRAHAARALPALKSADAADSLAVLLTDREWMVRAAARDALRLVGPPAQRTLERTLFHQDRFAANNAAEALHHVGTMPGMARRLLADPRDAATAIVVARFLDVCGPQLSRALLDQFTEFEAAQLLEHVADRRSPGGQLAGNVT